MSGGVGGDERGRGEKMGEREKSANYLFGRLLPGFCGTNI